MNWPLIFGVLQAESSSTETHSLLFDDLGQEFRSVFPSLGSIYPFAKETPILADSLFRLKKSSRQAKSSSY